MDTDSLHGSAQVWQFAAYRQLYQIGIKEKSYPVRLAVALEIAAGGDQAYAHLKEKFSAVLARLDHPDEAAGQSDEETQCRWREDVLCAWLAPLLAGSMSSRERGYARNGEDADGGQVDTPLPDKRQEDGRKSTDNQSPESILNGLFEVNRDLVAVRLPDVICFWPGHLPCCGRGCRRCGPGGAGLPGCGRNRLGGPPVSRAGSGPRTWRCSPRSAPRRRSRPPTGILSWPG
jgi:hypothetical protein